MGEGYDIPIVGRLAEALPGRPTALLLGTAPAGGKLPPSWRAVVLEAIRAGLDIRSGLHTLLGDDPELAAAAAAAGVGIVDYRRPPDREEVSSGRAHLPGKKVVLTVGTDCALGKMSVALELRKAAVSAGLSAVFVPTGQTGMMIDGWGISVDRVISDFLDGTCEWLVEQAEAMGDWIFVEGQGSHRPPGVQRRHARPHPWLHAARHGHGPPARSHAPPRLGGHALRAAPDVRAHPAARAAGRPWWRPPWWRPSPSTRRSSTRAPRGARSRAPPTSSACPATIRTASAASGCSTRCARGSREGRRGGERAMRVDTEVLSLAFRDPFRIARTMPDQSATTVIGTLTDEDGADRARRGLPGRLLRRDAGHRRGRRARAGRGRRRAAAPMPDTARRRVRAWLIEASLAMDEAHRAPRRRQVPASTSPSTTSPASGWAWPCPSCSARRATCRRPTSPSASTSPPSSPSGPRGRRDFPALKIKLGGPADLETLEAVRGGLRRPDPRRRQHRLDARGRGAAAARAACDSASSSSSSRSRPGGSISCAGSRSVRRCPSWPTRAPSSKPTSMRLVGVVQGVNVKLAKVGGVGPALRMIRRGARARASASSSAAWRRRARHRGVGGGGRPRRLGRSRRQPAAGRDPFTGLELGDDCRWQLPTTPGVGVRRLEA